MRSPCGFAVNCWARTRGAHSSWLGARITGRRFHRLHFAYMPLCSARGMCSVSPSTARPSRTSPSTYCKMKPCVSDRKRASADANMRSPRGQVRPYGRFVDRRWSFSKKRKALHKGKPFSQLLFQLISRAVRNQPQHHPACDRTMDYRTALIPYGMHLSL